MDPELIALLARLGELSTAELTDLQTRLEAYFAEQEDAGPGDDLTEAEHAALLLQIAEGVAAVRDRLVELAEAEATATAEAEATRERARRLLAGEPADDSTPDGDGDDDADEGDDEGDGDPADRTVEPVAAGAARVRKAGALGAMRRHAPRGSDPVAVDTATPLRITTALVAAADVRGFGAGTELTSIDQAATAIIAKLQGLGHGTGGPEDRVSVATVQTTYPDELVLRTDDPAGNARKIDAALRPGSRALVAAAGGLCGPLPVDYNIPEIGDLGRPFRDSKVRFNADRGGIRTNVTPSLTAADAGVGHWTIENDADPGGPGVPAADRFETKPIVEFDCGDEVSSYVYAMTYRARYSNVRARFNPETVASNARLGLVSHARLAELRLMSLQVSLSTPVTSAAVLGASKDLFWTLDGVTARMRYRQRRARNTPLRATIPEWVLPMLRSDLVRQMPAHNTTDEQYAIADAKIEQFFRARNVNPIWLTEDMDGDAAGGIGATQAAGALLPWPTTFRWFLEYEGDLLFLDAGELDLGVVRDSALNAVNRYETFYETFEGLHSKAAEDPLVITSTLDPNGTASGLTDLVGV